MAETVFAMVQRQEKERREAIARGEPDPFLVKQEEEPAREPNRLERFEEWMATDWEFGPYYWRKGNRDRTASRRGVGSASGGCMKRT